MFSQNPVAITLDEFLMSPFLWFSLKVRCHSFFLCCCCFFGWASLLLTALYQGCGCNPFFRVQCRCLVNNRFHLCVCVCRRRRHRLVGWKSTSTDFNARSYFTLQHQVDDVHLTAGNIFNSHWCWKLLWEQLKSIVVLPHMPIPFCWGHCLVFGSSLPFSKRNTSLIHNFLHVLRVAMLCRNREENRFESRRVVWCDYDVANAWKMTHDFVLCKNNII